MEHKRTKSNFEKALIIFKPKKLGRKLRRKIVPKLPERILTKFIKKSIAEVRPIEPRSGHVVIVCGSLQPGGAERQVANTLVGLQHSKIKNVVLLCEHIKSTDKDEYDFYLPLAQTSNWEISETRKVANSGCDTTLPKNLNYLRYFVNEKLANDVINLYQEFTIRRPEVVHAWLDWSNVRAGLAAILAGVPKVILSGRNYSPRHFLLNTYYFRPAYRAIIENRSTKVSLLNNSNAGGNDYANWLNISANEIQVLRNGTGFEERMRPTNQQKHEFREKYGIPIDAKVVGGMFRFNPEKDPLLWLEAANKISQESSNTYFLLFGDGSMKEELEHTITSYQMHEKIRMCGKISPSLIGLNACDSILLTSTKEGTPNVLLEAQWLGLPVVTTDAGGAAEAVLDGITGLVLNSRDPDLIAKAVNKSLQDKELIHTAHKQGPKFIEEQFGQRRMIKETLSIYNVS